MNKRQQLITLFAKRIRVLVKDENLYFRFFALFLAVVLWFLAGGEGRFSTVERTLSIEAQIGDLSPDFALLTEPENIRVGVRGFAPLIPAAEREIRATIDLSGVIEGEGTYGVDVTVPTGIELVSISPRWVRLRTERVLEQTFAVSVALIGLVPEQGIQSLTPNPSEVMVRGPRSALDSVRQVVADIALGGSATRLEGNFPVRAIDDQGRTVDQVSVIPDEVRVVLEQVLQQYEQQIPVIPQFQGILAPHLEINRVEINPTVLRVNIGANHPTPVEQLLTESIWLEQFDVGAHTLELNVLIPEGLSATEPPRVLVQLEIARIAFEEQSEDLPEGMPEPDLEAELEPEPELESEPEQPE